MNKRNRPKQFHRHINTNQEGTGFSDPYCYGSCNYEGLVTEVGGRNLRNKDIDHLIDWLIRVKAYRKYLKSSNR